VDYRELENLLRNLDTPQLEVIAGVAVRLASVSSERWTGKITFELTTNQGGISGDLKVNRGETVAIAKKRRIRSRL
jgi:hypothetical protein